MPFPFHTMAWLGEHRAFVVEELIQNGGSPIMTQRAFRIGFALGPVPDKKTNSQFGQIQGFRLTQHWFEYFILFCNRYMFRSYDHLQVKTETCSGYRIK
jgi:hypothetical protein